MAPERNPGGERQPLSDKRFARVLRVGVAHTWLEYPCWLGWSYRVELAVGGRAHRVRAVAVLCRGRPALMVPLRIAAERVRVSSAVPEERVLG